MQYGGFAESTWALPFHEYAQIFNLDDLKMAHASVNQKNMAHGCLDLKVKQLQSLKLFP
jgi:hypothetical protein